MATYRKMKKTGHFEARVRLGKDPETKKPLYESRTFKLKDDARNWATEQEAQRNKGGYQPTKLKLTFAEYLRDKWLPAYAAGGVRSTYNLSTMIAKWVFRAQPNVPPIGSVLLRKLTVDDFDAFYRAVQSQGMHPRGIRYLHGTLKQALRFAVTKKHLSTNPAQDATIPKHKRGPIRFLTRGQESRFLIAARKDRWSALWHLLLDSGIRPGEAFALKWEPDAEWQALGSEAERWGWIDFKPEPGALVKVRATLMRSGKGRRKLWPPKTENSFRDVPINEDTVAELKRWRKVQAADQLKAGKEWRGEGFVFTTHTGSPLGNNVGRAWERLLRKADGGVGDLGSLGPEVEKPKGESGPTKQRTFTPRFSVYVLRHTMATLNYLDGMDLGLLSRRLGHSSYAFTFDTYGRGVRAENTAQVAANNLRRWRTGSA